MTSPEEGNMYECLDQNTSALFTAQNIQYTAFHVKKLFKRICVIVTKYLITLDS